MQDRCAVFCVSASPVIGGGHVMRCLVLAQCLAERGWRCNFVCGPQTRVTVPALGGSGFAVHELDSPFNNQPAAILKTAPDGCDLLIFDDYKIDQSLEEQCRPWAQRILVIDDLADRKHDCDILLDQTLGRNVDDYRKLVSADAQFLLGSDYALLRPEFAQRRSAAISRRADRVKPKRILVSLGMIDAVNATSKILAGIHKSHVNVEVDVVLGSLSPHLDMVRAQIKMMNATVRLHVDHSQIWDLMGAADLAIGAAGSTSWERCCLGLPCVMVVTADNQVEVARALEASGAAKVLGRIDDLTDTSIAIHIRETGLGIETLSQMSKQAMMICDGNGVSRVLNTIVPISLKSGRSICSRPVRTKDTGLLFLWQSEPGARVFSRNPNPPTWDVHVQWMNHRLNQGARVFELLEVDGEPAGVVRLDCIKNSQYEYEVSILVAQNFQGHGIGGAGLEILRRLVPDGVFWAHVRADNAASRRMFLRAGYDVVDDELFRSGPRADYDKI